MFAPISPTLMLASATGHLTGPNAATHISKSLMTLAAQSSYTTEDRDLFQSIEAGLDNGSGEVDSMILKMHKGEAPLQSTDGDAVAEFLAIWRTTRGC